MLPFGSTKDPFGTEHPRSCSPGHLGASLGFEACLEGGPKVSSTHHREEQRFLEDAGSLLTNVSRFPFEAALFLSPGKKDKISFCIGRLFRCSPRVYEQKVTGLFSKGHMCQLERKRLQKATARCSFSLMVRNSLMNDGRPRTLRRRHSPRSTLTSGSFFVTLTSTFNDSHDF